MYRAMANTYPRFQASGSFAYSLYVTSAEAEGAARSSNGIVKRTTLFPAAIECPDQDLERLCRSCGWPDDGDRYGTLSTILQRHHSSGYPDWPVKEARIVFHGDERNSGQIEPIVPRARLTSCGVPFRGVRGS